MAYREVTMLEVKEVLRLWLGGAAHKRIAAQLGLNVKTVRRDIAAAQASGVARESGPEALDDGLIAAVVSRVQPHVGRPRGDGWADCVAQRALIERLLRQGVRRSKLRKLLRRHGVDVSYATLRRFAIAELGFGERAPTIPVADCGPGEEVQLDTGWMTHLASDGRGRRRRFRAWIFTAVLSRYRFVYPVLQETTASAIEACEAAWTCFQGVFRVLIPDNTKAIVQRADPLEPLRNPTFLEYAQARGFVIDPTRVRRARDKGRVERAVPSVREDCFAGEVLADLEEARAHARAWCLEEYGRRRHSRTLRAPREHFEAVEQPVLGPAPTVPYDVPLWCDPKVARDQHAQVARAFGLDAMDAQESRDAYEIFRERHRAGSMIVVSNRGPDEWLATFADPIRAQSAIDRFTSSAYDLVIEGESYRTRLKPSLKAPPASRKATGTHG